MIDRCVMCGEIVPEGRQVCPNCEKQYIMRCPRCGIELVVSGKHGGGYIYRCPKCFYIYPIDDDTEVH